jgi:hypothetical protein
MLMADFSRRKAKHLTHDIFEFLAPWPYDAKDAIVGR